MIVRGKRIGDGVLRVVTVNLKPYQIDILEEMEKQGIIINRSDAIRVALDDFIRDKLVILAIQQGINSGETLQDVIKKNPPKAKMDMRSRETYDRIRQMFVKNTVNDDAVE